MLKTFKHVVDRSVFNDLAGINNSHFLWQVCATTPRSCVISRVAVLNFPPVPGSAQALRLNRNV
jgi:hypothetical protein